MDYLLLNMKQNIIKRYFNRFQNLMLKKVSYIYRLPSNERIVYLTFDDGPEDGITEFVVNELNKYCFKATFFCRGDNAEKNQNLMNLLRENGHSVGNHTYNHVHSYELSGREYAKDVEQADAIFHSALFRPPHGSLTISAWLKLRQKYRIFFWSLNSGDSDMENYDYQRSIKKMKANTKSGDIVLFHFCHRHEKETRQLLPEYLEWLHEHGYYSLPIK